MTSVSDAELIARAREGDTTAFGALVDRYRTPVFRAALAALGRHDDAEDVTQETFVAAFHALKGFRGDAALKTWLVAIAWRKALTRRRSVRTWLARFVSPPGEHGWELPCRGRSPEQALLDTELRERVAEQVRHLSPKLRDALLLAASGEHTMDEIAALLGAPAGTVKWRISEARRQIRRGLGD